MEATEFQRKLTDTFSYNDLCNAIENEQNFSFVRYGDGELACVYNPKRGKNCDGHKYFDDLGVALESILLRIHKKGKPKYYHIGLQRLGYQQNQGSVDSLQIDWCKADMLHHASIKGQIDRFFDVIHGRENVCFVAPEYLSEMAKGLFCNGFVEVPQDDCWLDKKRINGEIRKYLATHPENPLIIFCSSMASNVWIDRWIIEMADKATFLDAGSVFDPYAGKMTRGYHSDILEGLNKK